MAAFSGSPENGVIDNATCREPSAELNATVE